MSPSLGDVTPALTQWSVPQGQQPFGIEVVSDRIWYTSTTGAIATLDPTTNTFTGWPVSGAGVDYPAFLKILGSKIFFTDLYGSSICILDLDTDKVGAIHIPTDGGGPFGLSLFPSASPTHVLFTESQAAKIGRLDLAHVQYVPVDAPRSSVTNSPTFNNVVPEVNVVTPIITPGNPNLPPPIASTPPMNPNPTFTEWAVPSFMTEAPGPIMITSDDTSYWFTTRKNSLGRLVNDDRIYVFSSPTTSARTMDLKLDSLGNIWYTAGDFWGGTPPDIIGKLELSTGTITEWTVPTTGGAPFCLTIDGSGMVWFTEFRGNKIGKLNPSTNTFHEFPVPNSGPAGIAVDSHGTIWFTEVANYGIGGLSTEGMMVPEFPVNIMVLMAGTSVVLLLMYATGKPKATRGITA